MKKLILSSFIFCFCALQAQNNPTQNNPAQNDYVKPATEKIGHFSIGINAGPSLTTFYDGNPFDQYKNASVRIPAGISTEFHFKKILSIVTGLYYDSKAEHNDFPIGYYYGNVIYSKNTFNYISLPLMARATFGKRVNFFVNAGGFAALLLKSSFEGYTNASPGVPKISETFDMTGYYKKIDFGVVLGAGVALPLTSHLKFTVELRNSLGVANILNTKKLTGPTTKTNATALLFGLTYRI